MLLTHCILPTATETANNIGLKSHLSINNVVNRSFPAITTKYIMKYAAINDTSTSTPTKQHLHLLDR